MVVDLNQLISDIVIDTDDKMHKQCKFCGKLLGIKDYMVLYENNCIENIATAYSRCNCEEANKIIPAFKCPRRVAAGDIFSEENCREEYNCLI